MPKEPCVLVFPSKTAKGGKFECRVSSLATLLDYRPDDNKESSFEVRYPSHERNIDGACSL
jgi:hypothetical protein